MSISDQVILRSFLTLVIILLDLCLFKVMSQMSINKRVVVEKIESKQRLDIGNTIVKRMRQVASIISWRQIYLLLYIH